MLVCTSALGQSYYSPYFRFATPSKSSGNDPQIGVGLDVNQKITNNIRLDADISAVYEPKSYVGDGYSYRSQAEIGYNIFNNVYTFLGASGAVHKNSSYTKKQYQPIASIHYIPANYLDLYFTRLFTANGNDNKLSGMRLGYRGYLKETSSNKSMFLQVEVTRISFTDYFAIRHNALYTTFGIGISFKAK